MTQPLITLSAATAVCLLPFAALVDRRRERLLAEMERMNEND